MIMRPLLIASLSAFVLIVLSGVFLIALGLVGLLAAAVAGFERIRRHTRAVPLAALDRQGIG